MFFETVWIVGYAPLIWRTVNVMPIFLASCSITATIFGSCDRVSSIIRMPWHCEALQVPFPAVSYFEPFIADFALATEPSSPGVLYGSNSLRTLFRIAFGTMWVATEPMVGP